MSKAKESTASNPDQVFSEEAEARRDSYITRVMNGEIEIPGVPALPDGKTVPQK